MRDYGDFSDYAQDQAYAEEQSFLDALSGQAEYEASLPPTDFDKEYDQWVAEMKTQPEYENEPDTIILPYTSWDTPPYDGPEDDPDDEDDDDDDYEDEDTEEGLVPEPDDEEIPF